MKHVVLPNAVIFAVDQHGLGKRRGTLDTHHDHKR